MPLHIGALFYASKGGGTNNSQLNDRSNGKRIKGEFNERNKI